MSGQLQKRFELDFVCAGAMKSGTTWLHNVLAQHPEANVPQIKEPCYFSENYDRGLSWYRKHWADSPGAKGECTAHYMYDSHALTRIRNDFPQARVIVILRNPVQRAVSHLLHLSRAGGFDLGRQSRIDENSDVIVRSLYFKPLTEIFNLWPQDQVKLVYHDQLTEAPLDLARDLFNFVGLDPGFVPTGVSEKIGTAYVARSPRLEASRRKIYSFLARYHMHGAIQFVRKSGIDRGYKYLNARPVENIDSAACAVIGKHKSAIGEDMQKLLDSPIPVDKTIVCRWLDAVDDLEVRN